MQRILALTIVAFLLALTSACTEEGGSPMQTVSHVDLERFMGDWYVIANIPTFIEKGAHNAVESYALNEDGSIATTFRFNQDAFDGPLKTYRPTGFVRDPSSNALWGMQFLWPFKADYRIVWLEPDNSITVIARAKRDYVWIMARQPEIAADKYDEIVDFIGKLGYDTDKVEKVPQRWPE
ncbi:lipocalin family protein [uncultured Thiocystis sp.]|jgi:apolipoprotein D and lipocalin family protein|uniref:lipocalin family protein n=1 Tax=uncultured Thiocystis sp. TaxID=1202134 RepID=UPI002600023B|nr:lipocalin family protein [uncultured Thiocystis sp.]